MTLAAAFPTWHEHGLSRQCVELSIVVPAFNEAQRLPHLLPRLCDYAADQPWEIILVDDCSADGTAAIARELLVGRPLTRVVELDRHRGKGAAVRAGVAEATGAKIMFMDADLATDLSHVPEMIAHLDDHAVVIGSRNAPGAVTTGMTPARLNMSRLFRALARRVIGLPLTDSQCGFKGFRAPVARTLFHLLKEEGWAFDVELLALTHALGLEIYEMPVRWVEVRGSHIRIFSDSTRMLLDVGRIARQYRRGATITVLATDATELDGALAGVLEREAPGAVALRVDGGMRVLLPFTDQSVADHICRRLHSEEPGHQASLGLLSVEELLSPGHQPLRSALMAGRAS